MSNPTDKYLDSAVDTYKQFVKEGDVIPLEFKFPSFNITKGSFNFYAIEALSERVRIGVDSGMYELQNFSKEITYDELVDYSTRKKIGLTTPTEDKTTGVLIDKILPSKINKDSSITGMEIKNAALINSCVRTMEFKVQELINFDYFRPSVRNDDSLRSEKQANELMLGTLERRDFVATLVAMREVLPQIHRKVIGSLNEREEYAKNYLTAYTVETNPERKKQMEQSVSQNLQIAKLVGSLKMEAANPSASLLERVLEVDSSLKNNLIDKYPKVIDSSLKNNLIDKYPKVMKEVFSNNSNNRNLKM